MPILDASHDFAHDVEGDSAWSESYYFNAYDPAVDTGLFTRIGVRPNEGTIDVGLSVWLPGDRIANVRGVREQTVMTDDDLAVGGVRYERLEPMRRWRLTAGADAEVLDLGGDTTPGSGRPGRVALDLTFTSLIPAIGTDGLGRERRSDDTAASTATTVGKGHLEQSGTWAGRVTLDGETWSLDPATARGNRDKSWGPRRWGGPQMWRWFSINIPGDGDDEAGTNFGGIRIGTPAGDLHRGWVWRAGAATRTSCGATSCGSTACPIAPASGPRWSTRAWPGGPTRGAPGTASASTCTSSTTTAVPWCRSNDGLRGAVG